MGGKVTAKNTLYRKRKNSETIKGGTSGKGTRKSIEERKTEKRMKEKI